MLKSTIERALQLTGEQLAASGTPIALVVVGGASLAVLGLIARATNDVDVIALATQHGSNQLTLVDARPLPDELAIAAGKVARDLGLHRDWLNAEVGAQIQAGLPPDLAGDLTWENYGALSVGFAGRRTLIALKLFAAADHGPHSVHRQDLAALNPTPAELDEASAWVLTQDTAPEFPRVVREVIADVTSRRA